MSRKKQPFMVRFRYSFDNFMSRGGVSVSLALISLFLAAIVLMAILRFVVNLITPDEKMADHAQGRIPCLP